MILEETGTPDLCTIKMRNWNERCVVAHARSGWRMTTTLMTMTRRTKTKTTNATPIISVGTQEEMIHRGMILEVLHQDLVVDTGPETHHLAPEEDLAEITTVHPAVAEAPQEEAEVHRTAEVHPEEEAPQEEAEDHLTAEAHQVVEEEEEAADQVTTILGEEGMVRTAEAHPHQEGEDVCQKKIKQDSMRPCTVPAVPETHSATQTSLTTVATRHLVRLPMIHPFARTNSR